MPGQDDLTWLAVNARAFADHPEQGRWTIEDLRLREAKPWFDPAGFLLAVRDTGGELIGFDWTKIHPLAPEATGSNHPVQSGDHRIGEIYVLGVDPAAQGFHLGRTLAVAGLRYLRSRGLPAAMLYVEGSNPRAMRLYERLQFTRWQADAQYGLPTR